MSKPSRAPIPPPLPDGPGRFAAPDRRLASLFIKRSKSAPVTAARIGMLTSYAPTQNGLAGFASSLRDGLIHDRPELEVGVVRIAPEAGAGGDATVVYELSTSDSSSDSSSADEFTSKAAAAELNKFDVAVILHDFEVFGGPGGEQALQVLNWIRVPTIVVVRTVPANPSADELKVLTAITESADAVVAMSETGRQRLIAHFGAVPRKTMVIPHGARGGVKADAPQTWPSRRPVILTWGLLEPGKGIEWAIEAMPALSKMRPLPRYVVAGQTDPRELGRQGEAYRDSLRSKVLQLGAGEIVEFAEGYLSDDELSACVGEADVVLLPYDSRDQVTSGVLAEAIAAGVPVVATRFSQAEELLTGEHGGLLVAHEDPKQIAAALTRVLTEPGLGIRLVEKASGLAEALSWPRVAAQYRQLFDALLRRPN